MCYLFYFLEREIWTVNNEALHSKDEFIIKFRKTQYVFLKNFECGLAWLKSLGENKLLSLKFKSSYRADESTIYVL